MQDADVAASVEVVDSSGYGERDSVRVVPAEAADVRLREKIANPVRKRTKMAVLSTRSPSSRKGCLIGKSPQEAGQDVSFLQMPSGKSKMMKAARSLRDKMVGYFHLIMILMLLVSVLDCAPNACSVASCWPDDPPIRFPFWLKGHQPEHCGYPGFELSCSDINRTVINFPSSGQFTVAEIVYGSQSILISDPEYCLPQRLMDFSVSETPFTLNNSLNGGFTLLSCEQTILGREIPCLSNASRSILEVPATQAMTPSLSSCKIIGNIPNTADGAQLELNWDVPRCGDCEARGGACGLESNTSLEVQCFNPPRPPNFQQGSKKRSGGEKFQTKVIIGTSTGVAFLLITSISAAFISKLTIAKVEEQRQRIEKILEGYRDLSPHRYSYADIKKMTHELRHLLGQGGHGTVFKGELENGVPVAVKILNNSQGNGEDFKNEVSTMGRIHHVNIVRLLGFCADASHHALVYEFMPNMSLDRFIFQANSSRSLKLGWEKLQNIAVGVARGIEYLHQGCEERILHFDIKPQNILLDGNFSAKVSDFGLARLFPNKESLVLISAVRGTMGYIAPELYFTGNTRNASYKSDVYSFGMLLFEMVGGRRNRDEAASQVYFPQWVYSSLVNKESVIETWGECEIAKKLAVVALWCIQWNPADRPPMKMVIQMLEGGIGMIPLPPDPFPALSSDQHHLHGEASFNCRP